MGAHTHYWWQKCFFSLLRSKSGNKNLVLQTKIIIHILSLYSCYSHTCIHARRHTHTHTQTQLQAKKESEQQPKHLTTTQTPDYKNNHPHTELAILLHTHTRRCLYSNPANCEGPSESHVSLKTYSLVPWSKSVNAITRNPSCHNHVPRSFFSCSPILFLAASTESTHTSTWSPSPKFWPGTRGGRILLTWISPFWPTPMSTKAPKWVTFVTLPVSRVPGLRSEMDVIPFLNSGFWKSAQEW